MTYEEELHAAWALAPNDAARAVIEDALSKFEASRPVSSEEVAGT